MEKPIVNVNVRMPSDLHERVKRQAERDMRSLNYEVLWLLAMALEQIERRAQPKQADAG